MTEIALLRLCSVPAALVEQIHAKVPGCPDCWTRYGYDTRLCAVASRLVEDCLRFELAKRHPEGTR